MNIIDAYRLRKGESIILTATNEVVKVIDVISSEVGPKITYQRLSDTKSEPDRTVSNLDIEKYYNLSENIRDLIPRVEVENLLSLALATGSAYGDAMNAKEAKKWIEHNLK